LSLFLSKFRFISSIVSPWGGPEEQNTHAHSEHPQRSRRSIHIIARAMPDYSAKRGMRHYGCSPSLGLIFLSVFVWADCDMRGCAISLVTLARSSLLDASFDFLSVFLLRMALFTDQTQKKTTQLNLENFQAAPQLSRSAVLPHCYVRDGPFSGARATCRTTHAWCCIKCIYSYRPLGLTWLYPLRIFDSCLIRTVWQRKPAEELHLDFAFSCSWNMAFRAQSPATYRPRED